VRIACRSILRRYSLQDGITFLNHGAFGATLKSCLDSKRQWAEYIEKQPVRFFDRYLVVQRFVAVSVFVFSKMS
jgi:hypothetical protein